MEQVYVVAANRHNRDELTKECKIAYDRFFYTEHEAIAFRETLGDLAVFFGIWQAELSIVARAHVPDLPGQYVAYNSRSQKIKGESHV